MNWLILFLTFTAGAAVAIQAGVNATLGRKTGAIEASFVSFLIGTLFLGILLLVTRKGNVLYALDVPKWQLAGGLLGGFYIMVMVTAVPKVGIAAALVTLIMGQLLCSTVIDHFGFIGDHRIPLDWKRLAGLLLMAAALFLFNKN